MWGAAWEKGNVRRIAAAIMVLGILAAACGPAWAKWIWRNGRWEYVVEPAQPPKVETPAPAPKAETPAPAPKAETPAPAPKAETPAPAPKAETPAPAPKAETPAPAPKVETPAPAPKVETPAPAPKTEPPLLKPQAATPKAEAPAPPSQPPAAKEPATAPPAAQAGKSWWQGLTKPQDENLLFEQTRQKLAAKDYRGADKDFKSLLKDYPASRNREEAMWLRAAALLGLDDQYTAFEQYEELVTQYAGSPHYRESLVKEIEIAEVFLGGKHRKLWGVPLLVSAESEGLEILRKVYEHQPTGDLADDVVLRIADYHWSKGNWQEAEDYYDKYCREYPNGEAARRAELLRAKCAIERCRGSRYDTTCLQLAYDRLKQFQQKFPAEAERENVGQALAQVRDMQALGLYHAAGHYLHLGRPEAAAYYVERIEERFADTPWCEKARQLLAGASMKQEPKP
jgi:outer membrane assembly lipoprotein YfiO